MKRTRLALAVCSTVARIGNDATALALAPCFFQIPTPAADAQSNLVEIQVTPDGAFKPRDNRKMPDSGHWHIDAAQAARVIADFKALKTPLVVDYEHQTLLAEGNGQPAPAAGFIRDLVWRDGAGLFAQVELTTRARQYVADGEYRYFSPVFLHDKRTGGVIQLLMGALTNNPGIDGMEPIALRAAARFHLSSEEPAMNKHLLAICTLLALATDNKTEDQIAADADKAIKDLQAKVGADPLAALRAELKLGDDVSAEGVLAACKTLQAKADGNPDPAKFVGVEVVTALRADLAKLTQQNNARAIDELVKPALEDGRLLPAQENWARDLGGSDIAKLKSYLDSAQPIAALRGTQTDGHVPEANNEHKLTAAELAVCKATGVDPKDFATAKPAAAAA